MAFCPNCAAEIPAASLSCPNCKASFDGEDAWKPVADRSEATGPKKIPLSEYSWGWIAWIVGGAVFGVLLRVGFGALPSQYLGPMSIGFLIGTPLAVGALTVYGARRHDPGAMFWLFAPWATIGLMLIGCGLALLEGIICIAILTPLFLLMGSIGGGLMGIALKIAPFEPSHLRAVAVVPLLLLFGESYVPLETREAQIRRSVHVKAPPAVVWDQILTARSIQPSELPLSITHLIGVPKPLEGVNVATADGEVRFSQWERGVNFRALVTERREHETITWRYQFDDHSFPAGSMDDHVAIGGRYFDLHDTTFNLYRTHDGGTQLEIVAHYRVTSSVNLYAAPIARLLGHDFVGTILQLYKTRSERAVRL